MALPGRPMHVPAGLPLDEATRPEILDVGKANVFARNVRGIERGSLEKRLGYNAKSSVRIDGTTRSAGQKLFAHGDAQTPCVIDGVTLDVWAQAQGKWSSAGRVPEAVYRLRDAYATPQSVIEDVAVANGMIALAIGDSLSQGLAELVVVDAVSGAIISPPHAPTGFVNGALATVGAFSNRYFIAALCDEGSSLAIKAYLFDTMAVATGWTLLATVTSATATQVVPVLCELADRVAIAWATTSGTDRVSVATFNQSGLLATTTLATSSDTPQAIAIDSGASGVLWVAFVPPPSATAFVVALNASTLAVAGAVATFTSADTVSFVYVCGGTTANTGRICAGGSNDFDMSFGVSPLLITSGAVVVPAVTQVYNAFPTSRPFCIADRFYMLVAPSTVVGLNDQNLAVLVDWTEASTTWRPVANIEPGLVCTISNVGLPKVASLGAGKYVVPIQLIKSGSTRTQQLVAGFGTTGCALVELDFASDDRWQAVAHHGVTALSGGLTSTFDGVSVTELGFLARPTKPIVSATGTGITGTFSYVAIYESVDAVGNWVVSGISDPTSSGAVSNKTVSISTAPYTVTSRASTRVAWYRTATGGEPPYYRLGTTPCDPSQSFVLFTDRTSDDDLTTRAKLYAPSLPGSVGESLDRRAPPGLRHLVSYAGMLVGSRGASILFSGQEVYGEATWFSPVFEVPLSAGGGDITAIAAIDGSLIVWKYGSVYMLSGESPSDNGAAGGFSDPRLIASDVGCIDARSVVVTSLGVFFQSARGIELFARSQSVQWIGEPIQDTLAVYPTVTAVVVDARNSLVRFSLANDSAGVDLVFDLAVSAWISIDDRTLGAPSVPSADAAIASFDGTTRYACLTHAGVVWSENDETDTLACRDGSAWVTSQYAIPPWKLGLQQEQRIYEMMLLFETRSSAGITIEVAEDFGAYAAETADKVWFAADLVGGLREISLRPRERGTATQLRMRDTDPGGAPDAGRGITWVGLSADIAQKQGPTRGTPRINPDLRR